MRIDYSKLIGAKVEVIIECPAIPRGNVYDNQIPSIFFDMQKIIFLKGVQGDSVK